MLKFDCHVLYQRLTIGADGKILLCYNDEFDNHVIGHIDKDSIYNVWHGEKCKRQEKYIKKIKV